MANKTLARGRLYFWKYIADFWSIMTIGLYTLDFFSKNKYNSAAGAISVLFISILGLYAGSKEFDRWTRGHASKFHGEYYVPIWTFIIALLSLLAVFSHGQYQLPSEAVATYIGVLGIFVITQKSKGLHFNRRRT
ncbi:MAG: hypothetical protein WC734_00715 [Patescibacteria group bacterium]|jgi:hypothetical protein